ncbi:dihydrolipoamide succinyltransferase, partial [Pseudoalteromonas sp. S2721]|uniref:biotin/lipoyl-containing protein n=1 Tax=Pseudoalteromonas sp. S2721 TaxID=579526 RepID=UPI001281D443
SVADATIATWHVHRGEAVSRDQTLVAIAADKGVLEVVAEEDGIMGEHIHAEGETVLGEQVIGTVKAGAAPAAAAP